MALLGSFFWIFCKKFIQTPITDPFFFYNYDPTMLILAFDHFFGRLAHLPYFLHPKNIIFWLFLPLLENPTYLQTAGPPLSVEKVRTDGAQRSYYM